jgi:hypothetical protein
MLTEGQHLTLVIPPAAVVRPAVVLRASHPLPTGDRPPLPGPFTTLRVTAPGGFTYETVLLDTVLATLQGADEDA